MSLKDYKRKRDFSKTSEPEGKLSGATRHRFVVQKHDATRLHYDFRLELGGTLKSWAVPKGIPLKKGEKRLAVEVEPDEAGPRSGRQDVDDRHRDERHSRQCTRTRRA